MKGRNYRIGNSMPYVRREYIRGSPQSKINKFVMGDASAEFPCKVLLIPLKKIQVRHNALESTRVTVNKILMETLGDKGYCLRMRVYPHVILRENKMMAFAGADRVQEGMRRSFGKPMGLAARVEPGQPLVEVDVHPENIETAKQALQLGINKLPTPCITQVSGTQCGKAG